MSLSIDNILVKNWIRTHASSVNKFYEGKPKMMEDFRMWYYKAKDVLHYDALVSNNFDIYNEYIETTSQKEHSVAKFKALINDWDISKMDKIQIGLEEGRMVVCDGVHRIVIYIHKTNASKIPIKYLNIKYTAKTVSEIGAALIETTKASHYNGWSNSRTKYGYHSFDICNIQFAGQRNPVKRLDIMRSHYSFENKYLIDIGCNTGGMLFHCTEINKGKGVDFDRKCLDAAEIVKTRTKLYDHLDFFQSDLDKDNPDIIFSDGPADVVFLLSLGSWIKNWRQLDNTVMKNTSTIFLETNKACSPSTIRVYLI